MDVAPISYNTVKFNKCELLVNRLLIGIDSGSSMTKIVFLHKDHAKQLVDDSIEKVTLSHCLFCNENFEDAIKWTRQNAYLPKDIQGLIHLTGSCARSNIEVVERILGVKAIYIDEMLTIAAGCKIGIEKIGLDQMISPTVEHVYEAKIENEMFEKFAQAMSSKFDKDQSSEGNAVQVFPCLIHVYGSMSGFFYFDKSGKGEFISCFLTGGKTFMGLAKCLTDTNNYDEILQLASKGNRANVDTQVKEVMEENGNSPYGNFPPELPLFPFGKCMDHNLGLEECSKEDLAMSLVAYFAFMVTMQCAQLCMVKRISKAYITGNIFRSSLFKKEIQRLLMIFPFQLQLEILDFGYFGALGAVFCDNEDKEQYYYNDIG